MAAHIGRETYHLAWDAAIPPVTARGFRERRLVRRA